MGSGEGRSQKGHHPEASPQGRLRGDASPGGGRRPREAGNGDPAVSAATHPGSTGPRCSALLGMTAMTASLGPAGPAGALMSVPPHTGLGYFPAAPLFLWAGQVDGAGHTARGSTGSLSVRSAAWRSEGRLGVGHRTSSVAASAVTERPRAQPGQHRVATDISRLCQSTLCPRSPSPILQVRTLRLGESQYLTQVTVIPELGGEQVWDITFRAFSDKAFDC